MFRIAFYCIGIFLVFGVATGCEILINPTANIVVLCDDIEIDDNSEYSFGQALVGASGQEVVFTIKNAGNTKLRLADPNAVKIFGNTDDFSINQSSLEPILKPQETTSFTITFVPTSATVKDATISIMSNDIDENPFEFKIKGTGIIPEINVRQDNTNLPEGSGIFDFGRTKVGDSSATITFTIENTGAGELELTGYPDLITLYGAHPSMFILNQTMTKSSLSTGAFTTFTITFVPLSMGDKFAQVKIENTDQNENPYVFSIMGEGYTVPEINVQDSLSNNIPNTSGVFDFGIQTISETISRSFIIQNLGIANLHLTGTPKIEITGPDASTFTVSAQPSNQISPGYSSTFTIDFTPTNNQNFSAIVSIPNNDDDENPYTFILKGVGRFPDSDFNADGIQDVIVGSPRNDRNGKAFIFFGKNNLASNITASNADVTLIGDDLKGEFGAAISNAGDINNDGIDDIIISATQAPKIGQAPGNVYIFFGRKNWATNVHSNNADVKLTTVNMESIFGFNVSSAGDVNKDGFDDIIVTTYNSTDTGIEDDGAVYLFFGRQNWPTVINESNADVKFYDQNNSRYGMTATTAGDINNDGFDDLLISLSTDKNEPDSLCVDIFFGKKNWASEIESSNANVKLIFASLSSSSLGYTLADAGDVNADGIDDVIIGARNDGIYALNAGAAFIFYGRLSWSKKVYSTNADVKIFGENIGNHLGSSVSTAGDINNDGCDDVVIGAPEIGTNSGKAYIIFGNKNLSSTINASNADIEIVCNNTHNSFGYCVSSAGDINNDGFCDVIIGASVWPLPFPQNLYGYACIIYGGKNISSTINYTNADVMLVGVERHDGFGYSVSGEK